MHSVLILPMRNGNLILLLPYFLSFYSSYPTYEEWKQTPNDYGIPWLFIVLILPMRNGNLLIKIITQLGQQFLSYL